MTRLTKTLVIVLFLLDFTSLKAQNTSTKSLQLQDFVVLCDNEQVKLSWIVNFEPVNTTYGIQKSSDGMNFQNLVFVPGLGGGLISYSYNVIDSLPIPHAYYRLVAIDQNGQETHLETQFLSYVHNDYDLYPNPFTAEIHLNSEEEGYYDIIDSDGKVLLSGNYNKINTTIDLRSLKTGVYIVKLYPKFSSEKTVLISKVDW